MSDFIADPKKVNEKYYIGIDFSDDLGGSIIETASITEPTNTILDPAKEQLTNTIAYFWVQGGTAGETYEVTVGVTAEDDSYYEKTVSIKVV